MVALFVAFVFLFFIGLDIAQRKYFAWRAERAETRFIPGLGLCMADGGDPVKKEEVTQAPVVQPGLECFATNEEVAGSNPVRGSIIAKK